MKAAFNRSTLAIGLIALFAFTVAKSQSSLIALSYNDDGYISGIMVKVNLGTSYKIVNDRTDDTAIFGDWQITGVERQYFTPYLPLDPDHQYYLRYLDSFENEYWLVISSDRKPVKLPLPEVVQIYPTASRLPENLLRFYIAFSLPMRENGYLQHISFTDEQNGEVLNGVFLPSRQEYWNKERTKLTIIFDPGRVKTGLMAHQEMGGRVLKPGNTYTLNVQTSWQALNGKHLQRQVSKTFEVTPEDMRTIVTKAWRMDLPKANTNFPLKVYFDRSMDHINAQSYLLLLDQYGHSVPGQISLSHHESVWEFQPTKKWDSANYRLVVNKKMEDVCGNNLMHGFDVHQASEKARWSQKKELISIKITE